MNDLQKLWINEYENLKHWIRPYLGGKIRLDEIDVFVVSAFIDMMKFEKDKFIILDKIHRYAFHKPSGYLLHIFGRAIFNFIKPKFGHRIIRRIDRIEPGRKIVFGERKIPGPRGGKLFALGSATHISTNEKVVPNPRTKKWLRYMKQKVKLMDLKYPDIYEAERKYWYKPFKFYFLNYAIKRPYPHEL
jgi:hypothetical protein